MRFFLQLLLEVNQLVTVTKLMKKLHSSRNYALASFLLGLLQYNPSKFIDSTKQHCPLLSTSESESESVKINFSLSFAAMGKTEFYLLIEVSFFNCFFFCLFVFGFILFVGLGVFA